MAIKKAYAELVAFLEENKDSKVKTILPGVIDLCSAKAGGFGGGEPKFKKDDKGVVTHVFCYYHKKWEEVAVCEYGVKTTSPTGLSNMCKEGTSMWTKQQRAAKKAKEDLLTGIAIPEGEEGHINVADLAGLQADIEAYRGAVIPREDGHGTDEV